MYIKTIALGRITKDPEIKVAANDLVICNFSLAVDRPGKGKDHKADFWYCTAFGKTAEIIGNNCSKGQRLLVEGRMQQDSYKGKDGVERQLAKIIVSQVIFIEKKTAQGSASPMDTFTEEIDF